MFGLFTLFWIVQGCLVVPGLGCSGCSVGCSWFLGSFGVFGLSTLFWIDLSGSLRSFRLGFAGLIRVVRLVVEGVWVGC